MNFRTGPAAGAGGALAALSVRRLGRRALGGIVQRLERRLERAVRDLTAKAEQGGPLVKAALAGARALYEGKSPVRALLSFGWTALKETLARIFGRGRRGKLTNIVEQVPDRHIVWRSEGPKGHVDGAVSFHRLTPDLTRVLLVLEYRPGGLFERTGDLWRAQGRRARLELKHFRRHVMTQALTRPDEVEGWRGEIRDGEIVTTPK